MHNISVWGYGCRWQNKRLAKLPTHSRSKILEIFVTSSCTILQCEAMFADDISDYFRQSLYIEIQVGPIRVCVCQALSTRKWSPISLRKMSGCLFSYWAFRRLLLSLLRNVICVNDCIFFGSRCAVVINSTSNPKRTDGSAVTRLSYIPGVVYAVSICKADLDPTWQFLCIASLLPMEWCSPRYTYIYHVS